MQRFGLPVKSMIQNYFLFFFLIIQLGWISALGQENMFPGSDAGPSNTTFGQQA